MKNQEAKFILGAFRPDGRDAGDATFSAALAQAEKDPELRAWFETQRKFDTAVAAKLQQIAPPAGLKEAILAGSRVTASVSRRRWWQSPLVLAAAAALLMGAYIGVRHSIAASRPTGSQLAASALKDLAEAHSQHVGHPVGLDDVMTQLTSNVLPLSSSLKVSLAELAEKNCRSMRVGSRQVFEICFQRDGTWYHVYIGNRKDFAPGTIDPKGTMTVDGQYAAAAWADANHVYALVTHAGADALRRLI